MIVFDLDRVFVFDPRGGARAAFFAVLLWFQVFEHQNSTLKHLIAYNTRHIFLKLTISGVYQPEHKEVALSHPKILRDPSIPTQTSETQAAYTVQQTAQSNRGCQIGTKLRPEKFRKLLA